MEGTCNDCVFPLNEGEYKDMYCEGVTSLMHAAYTGRERCVNELLQAGADVNQMEIRNQTALIYALQCERDNEKCVQLLVNAGADLNYQDVEGQTALLHALQSNFIGSYLQILLTAGADVNHTDLRNQTPLLIILQEENCHDSHVELLLKAGAEVNVVDTSGYNSIHSTHSTVRDYTPLILAGISGQYRCVDLLLEAGADVNKTSDLLTETLRHACEKKENDYLNYTKCVGSFLKAGAAVNYYEESYHNNPLQAAIGVGHFETTQLLIKAGADLIREDWNYGTSLMRASEHGWVQGVRLLLSTGADVNLLSQNSHKSEWSPLWSAVKEIRINTVRVLLNAGSHIITQSPLDSRLKNPLPFHLSNMYRHIKLWHEYHIQDEPLAMLLFAAGASPMDEADEDDNYIPEFFQFLDIKYDLKHMSRESIRRNLMRIDRKRNLFLRIPKLGIPPSLSQYLLYYMSLFVKPDLKYDDDDDDV